VPDWVSVPNRIYMNLLQFPVLFYVVCLMDYVTGRVSAASMTLAWIYVALRTAHSGIYLTCNNVFHRLAAFAVSNFVILGMWVLFFVSE
jgi:hypothetical protein